MVPIKRDPAIGRLQDYLRIRSVQPNVDYGECIKFLINQAKEIGLVVQVVEPAPKKPALVMSWIGTQPELPSILLGSHMDVVPVSEKLWKHAPFAAEIENNTIYARGAQDMKSVSIQYLDAVRRLKDNGIKLKRTIHLSFVADEEIGGKTGMAKFIETDVFNNLNVGFALDEGAACTTNDFKVFNGEKSIWRVKVTCSEQAYTGSLLLPDNCGTKLRYIIDKFMDLRAESVKQLADNPQLNIGDVTSVNLTMVEGGIRKNVIPKSFSAIFDIRIALTEDLEQFEKRIQRWGFEAGSGVTYEFIQKDSFIAPTPLDDTNIYWIAFKQAAEQLGMSLQTLILTGGTNNRYIRSLGIPALGFSPINNSAPTAHGNNECLNLDVFLNGIQVYETILPALANV